MEMLQTLILVKENTTMIIKNTKLNQKEQKEVTRSNTFPPNPREEKVDTVLQTNARVKTVLANTHANDDDDNDKENDMDLWKMHAH